jgi:hypothetical protein
LNNTVCKRNFVENEVYAKYGVKTTRKQQAQYVVQSSCCPKNFKAESTAARSYAIKFHMAISHYSVIHNMAHGTQS